VSGCRFKQDLSWEYLAKTMTNNLPILSVLAKEPVIFSEYLVVKVHELFTF
jgi:hypothetical protein